MTRVWLREAGQGGSGGRIGRLPGYLPAGSEGVLPHWYPMFSKPRSELTDTPPNPHPPTPGPSGCSLDPTFWLTLQGPVLPTDLQ